MKWFKHYSETWDDEKISALIDVGGLELYGFWWRILEIIAKQMDKTPKTSCQYSAKKWGNFCGISAKRFQKFAEILAEKKIISADFGCENIYIDVPNLAKYRDEWTLKQIRNDGKTPE